MLFRSTTVAKNAADRVIDGTEKGCKATRRRTSSHAFRVLCATKTRMPFAFDLKLLKQESATASGFERTATIILNILSPQTFSKSVLTKAATASF